MKFIIKRSKWIRGRGPIYSLLLNDEGQMCCLGFCAVQSGVSEETILEKGYLTELPTQSRAQMTGFFSILYDREESDLIEKEWVKTAYKVNDSKIFSEAEREERLAELAKANGHEFEFVD